MTEGVGRCQREGGPIEEIRPGDRVFFEPGENHWHGAAPGRFMVHIAMQQVDETGSPVTWGEHVTDEQYGWLSGAETNTRWEGSRHKCVLGGRVCSSPPLFEARS